MIVKTATDIPIDSKYVMAYFENLVNQFFKILPMRENGEESVYIYMRSLQVELLGCCNFLSPFKSNPSYLALLSILEYLIDTPNCSIDDASIYLLTSQIS